MSYWFLRSCWQILSELLPWEKFCEPFNFCLHFMRLYLFHLFRWSFNLMYFLSRFFIPFFFRCMCGFLWFKLFREYSFELMSSVWLFLSDLFRSLFIRVYFLYSWSFPLRRNKVCFFLSGWLLGKRSCLCRMPSLLLDLYCCWV